MDKKAETLDEEKVKKRFEDGKKKAKKLLEDEDKLEKLLQKMEQKLKVLPIVGETFALVPAMISLVRSYIKKEYTQIPLGSILGIISALIYIVSPIDLVPDFLPGGVGYIDDATVLILCLKAGTEDDIKEYQKWREDNNKNI